MSENIVLILVGALVLLVLVLVGVILYLFNKILKEKDMTQAAEHSTEPSRSDRARVIVNKDKLKAQAADIDLSYCANHPQDHAKGVCAICSEAFCEECTKEHDGLTFCGPHFRLYIGHEWTELETIKTTPETPESAFPIYDFKKHLWEEEGLPAVISTHYKINLDNDSIESYVKLLVRSDELDSLSERYQQYKH